jgi:hypothetical protein
MKTKKRKPWVVNRMDEEGYVEEVKYGRTQFDYKQVLLIHIRNMSNLITQKIFPNSQQPYNPKEMLEIADEAIENSFEWGVDFLDGLLSAYGKKDKKYNEELDKLKKQAEQTKMLTKAFNKKKFNLLVQLMDRLNLLLEGEGSEKY